MRPILLAVALLVLGCSTTQPIDLPTPASAVQEIPAYSALLVTDSAGKERWVYNPRVARDTLWGTLIADASRPRIAIPLGQIRTVATTRFSAGRTVGLIGGLAGVVAAAVLLAHPEPDYALGYR